jgi:FMN reductase/FAD reductase [NAD(P)H]
MKLLGISGNMMGTKTSHVVEKVLEEVKKSHPNVEVELLDLKRYNMSICDGRGIDEYQDDTKAVVEKVNEADFYVIGTPIFQGSLSGALKNLFDFIDPKVLRNKVIGFIATGGTYQHYLVIENQLKPIAGYFRAFVAPSYVYAHTGHFSESNEIIDQEVLERIQLLAEEVVTLQKGLHVGQTIQLS